MNKKELAKEALNHPMMKVLRESKGVDNKVLIRILAEEILAEAESADLKSVKGAIRRATNLKLDQKKLQANYDLQKTQLEATQIKHIRFRELSDEEKITALKYLTKRLQAVAEVLKTPEPEREEKAEELEQTDQTEPATSDEIEGTDGETENTEEPPEDTASTEIKLMEPTKAEEDAHKEILKSEFLNNIRQDIENNTMPPENETDAEDEALNVGSFLTWVKLFSDNELQEDINDIFTNAGEKQDVVKKAWSRTGQGTRKFVLAFMNRDPRNKEWLANKVVEITGSTTNSENATKILNQFLDIIAQVLKGSPLQEQEVKDKEFGEPIMAFLKAAGANSEQVEQIKTKLGEVELDLRVVDQALRAEGAVEKALKGLKQRLEAPTEPEEAAAEATPENEDLEELPKAELQRKMLAQSIEPVDKFFDDTDGFLKQLLLSDQGKLLRDMIVGLGKIERGDLGGDLALTDFVVTADKPDPQPETKPDEGETTSEPPEKVDLQEQEEPQVPANAKARRMVKNEVAAIRDLLKDVVAVAKRYEENATSTNIDSRFDGTKLKVVFDEKLEATQRQIARLVAIIGKVMEEAMADKAGEQLQEQDVKTRQEKVKLVQDTYRDLRRLYKNSFQVQAGEKFDFAKAQQAARNMINVVDDSGIVAFYPRITNFDATTGQVITLGQAYEEMTKLVKKLAKTTADIFLNVRDGEVEVNNMQRAILDLQDISSAIENYYGIKSMIRAKDIVKIDPEQAQTFIGYGQREASPLIGTGQGKETPAPPEQPPMSADVEIIDEPMSRNDFIREYIKGDRYEELKNTGVSNQEIRTLADFLRQLKFNYEQSQVNEKKGDGLRKIINFSKGQFSGDLFTDTLASMGAVRNSAVLQRLNSVLDKATDFTIELIEDMLGITLSTTGFENPLDKDFNTGLPKRKIAKTPPRKRDAQGRRMEEQLINKLIPIVESILKD